MKERNTVELGDEVQDLVTGYKGIAVGITQWLYGCKRVSVQGRVPKAGGVAPDNINIDEPQCKILKKAKVKISDEPQQKSVRETGSFDIKVSQRPNLKKY